MKISYDKSVDVMTIGLSEEKIDHAEEVDNIIIIHFSEKGKPVILDILGSSEFLPQLAKMATTYKSVKSAEVST